MRLWLAALAIVLTPAIPRIGNACIRSLIGHFGPHVLAPVPGDTAPPTIVNVSATTTERNRAPICGLGSDCGDDPPKVAVDLEAFDDHAEFGELGFEFRVVDGEPPEGLLLPEGAVLPSAGEGATSGGISMVHDDDGEYAFNLEVRVYDTTGNSAITVIRVERRD